MDPLFQPLTVGDLELPHRVLMAPLTRSRSSQPGDVPNEMMAEYYRQRAGAGLIISEATQISPQGKGYAFTPGIFTEAQIEGWRTVTHAVHDAGGRIFLQLWHVGRISNTALQPGGAQPVAPSAIRAGSKTYIDADSGMVPVSEPRALETHEIPGVVDQYRTAAQNAKDAGFDGVEIHGANGYLLDQFLRSGTNHRTDAYGGTLAKRLRFPREVAEAVVDVWGPGRVGYRISPTGDFNSMHDDDPAETFSALAGKLADLNIAYLHAAEAFAGAPRDQSILGPIREAFGGVYIANGSYTAETAREAIEQGRADAVAFGELFIANPDLPERFRKNAPLTEPDKSTYYGGGAKGYTDYPTLAEQTA
jgi:N-ethylmaleimide reductase